MQGSIAYFGTYSVSETDKVITFHLEGSTFPNWKGADQKRFIKLSGDELTWTVPYASVAMLPRSIAQHHTHFVRQDLELLPLDLSMIKR